MIRKTQSKRQSGKFGEQIASHLLTKDGYNILCRNYTAIGGEIDIIASKGEYICFVEVKMRKIGTQIPREAVDENKLFHIHTAMDAFLSEYGDNIYISSLKPRIDIMEIYTYKNTYHSHNHITNIT